MYGIIYKISNNNNKKVYIGQTTTTCSYRFSQHVKAALDGAKFKLSSAIRKYGPESFLVEKIDEASSQEELSLKEIYWIAYYDSFNNGYNMTTGGEGANTYAKRSPEQMAITRAKIAKKAREHNSNHGQYVGELNSMYGKHHSEKTKKRMSLALSGRKKSEAHRKHISEAIKGVAKNYIPAVTKLYVLNIHDETDVEQLSAKEVVGKFHIKDFKELKVIVDNKKIINETYIISKSVSTIPDECKGVGQEISTCSKRTTTEK